MYVYDAMGTLVAVYELKGTPCVLSSNLHNLRFKISLAHALILDMDSVVSEKDLKLISWIRKYNTNSICTIYKR